MKISKPPNGLSNSIYEWNSEGVIPSEKKYNNQLSEFASYNFWDVGQNSVRQKHDQEHNGFHEIKFNACSYASGNYLPY